MAFGLAMNYLTHVKYQVLAPPASCPLPRKARNLLLARPSRSRKAAVPHVIDYEPESPVIRQQEAEMARRKGYRNALWLIIAISVVALGKLVWEEAFEKNSRFLLKALDVQTSGPLSVPKLVAATALTLDTNLLTLNLGEVRSRLERLPQVKGVHIQRDYNGSLTIKVQQRFPVAWLECAKQKLRPAQRHRMPDRCRRRADAL
jgi:cell division septal protein FtsQ